MRTYVHCCLAVLLTACWTACAANVQNIQAPAAEQQLIELFAAGEYARCLKECVSIIDRKPGCPQRDQALYYAALSSLRLDPGPAGRAGAIHYLKTLAAECPASMLRPAADTWVQVLAGAVDCSRELERLRRENARLDRELDLLKNVDVQLHRQKMDTGNGAEAGTNTRP